MSETTDFGETVRDLRLSRRETQAEFGRKIGRSLNYVSEIERGVREPSETVRTLIEHMIFDTNPAPSSPGDDPASAADPIFQEPETSPYVANPNAAHSSQLSRQLIEDMVRTLDVPALRGYVESLGAKVAKGNADASRLATVLLPIIGDLKPEVFSPSED